VNDRVNPKMSKRLTELHTLLDLEWSHVKGLLLIWASGVWQDNVGTVGRPTPELLGWWVGGT
jgi:hypothetical protein